MGHRQTQTSHIPGRILAGFGVLLGLCASVLPFTSHAIVQVDHFPDWEYLAEHPDYRNFFITIEDYYELSIINNTAGTGVTFEDGIYSATMSNGTANSAFGTTTLGAVCNSTHNWKIQAESVFHDSNNISIMRGQATGLNLTSGSTALDGTVSTWTMAVSAGDNSPSVESTFANPHIIPYAATTIATGTYGDLRTINVTYGVAIGPSQAADTYIGSIKYTLAPQS